MSAPFEDPVQSGQEVYVHWDAETGFTIVEADPENILLDACLHAAARSAKLFGSIFPLTAAVLGSAWLMAHAVKWAGL